MLLVKLRLHQLQHILQQSSRLYRFLDQGHLSRINTRQVKNIIDQRFQVSAGSMYHARLPALFPVKPVSRTFREHF